MTRSLRFEAAILLGLLAFFLPSRFVGAQTETPESTASATEPQGATETQNATLNEVQTEELADPNALAAIELYAQGNVEGAFQLFKKVYDANPDSDPPGVLLALLHSHAGRFLDMRRSLEQTAEDYPTDPEAFLQLAGIDVQEGRLLEAQLLVERAEKLIDGYKENRPETVTRLDYLKEEALTARANLAEKRERYDDAKSFVRKVLELDPENAQAYWNLGYLSMKTRKLEDAEAAFDEAAKRNPELWPGWLQVATSLDREDLVEEGKELLEARKDAAKAAPKNQRAQVARLYLRFHMIDEAAKIAEEFANENEEKDLDRWLLAGWIALYADRYKAAEERFRNATLVDPENFEASNGLALALLDQSNKEKLARARIIATKNYHSYPDSPEAAITYAWTLYLSGDQKGANEIFGPMLSSGQMTATVAYYLAEIAHSRGDSEMARTLVGLALSQKSNFPKRNAALELQKILEPEAESETDPMDDFDVDAKTPGEEEFDVESEE
ncbi:MAG: tetratricopeptide repeat protein [Thermoguttaceae bacterium]|nr:tetratricopeptide repeat protein [Thermoguttaceae bacterium]